MLYFEIALRIPILLLFSVHPEPNGRKVDKMLTLKKDFFGGSFSLPVFAEGVGKSWWFTVKKDDVIRFMILLDGTTN